jgi:hypothetical protein
LLYIKRLRDGEQTSQLHHDEKLKEHAVPEISAGGAKLAEQAAADAVAVEQDELVEAGPREADDGGVFHACAVQPQTPQALVRRQQRAQHVERQGHLLQSPNNRNDNRVSLCELRLR